MNLPFAFSAPGAPPHVRLFGVPVRVETSFFIIMALLALSSRQPWQIAVWVVVSFVAVLVHELGHALTARAFGQAVRIELHGMGGSAHHHGPPLSTTKRVLVSLAGPFAGFALGALFWFVPPFIPGSDHTVARLVVNDILWITLGYGLLNLLPIYPLDGGQALRAVLVRQWPARGAFAADIVSVVVAAVVVVAALALRSFGLGFLVLWLLMARGQELHAAWSRRT